MIEFIQQFRSNFKKNISNDVVELMTLSHTRKLTIKLRVQKFSPLGTLLNLLRHSNYCVRVCSSYNREA